MPKTKNIIATSIFLFEGLQIKKDLSRLLKVVLKTTLPQSFREYTICLSYNEEPIMAKIGDIQNRIDEIKADKQSELFPNESTKKAEIKSLQNDINDLEDELKEAIEQTKKIEFFGLIQKIEYKDGDTLVTVDVPTEVISDINEVASMFGHYKIELIRE